MVMGNQPMTVNKYYKELQKQAKKNNKIITDQALWETALRKYNDYCEKLDKDNGNEIR